MKVSIHRRVVLQWPMILWLVIVWVFLWGDITIANIIVGLVLALTVTLMFPLPPVAYSGRPSLGGLVLLGGRFLRDVVMASVQVTKLALSPSRSPREAVIAVPLRSQSDLYLTITAEFVSLVPGSLIVETQPSTGLLYVHVLDVDGDEGVEKARQEVWEQEARVLRALASSKELIAAGLPPRRGWKPEQAAPVNPAADPVDSVDPADFVEQVPVSLEVDQSGSSSTEEADPR